MIHHSHLRFAAIVGATCGLAYAGLTFLPEFIAGCYGPNGGQGFCGLGFVILNLPSSFIMAKIAGANSSLSLPPLIAVGDVLIFAVVNTVVVSALRRSNWKILVTTNLLLAGVFFALPFVIQRFL